MRAASDILKSKEAFPASQISWAGNYWLFEGDVEVIIKAINEARKEAIEECAEIASMPDNLTKQSIFSLINELK